MDSALVFALAIATFLTVGIAMGGGLAGLAVAELVGLVALPLGLIALRRAPLASIGIAPAPWRALLGGALVGVSIWYIDLRIATPLLDDDPAATRDLDAMVRATPLAAIVVLSIVPAIGEELSCRGVLALGLRPRLGAIAAVAISTAAFAILHPSPARMLPMCVLGAVLGTLTVRTRSVFPAMIAHAVNNAMALLLAEDRLSPVAEGVSAHPDLVLLAALVTCIAGVALAWRGTRTDPGRT